MSAPQTSVNFDIAVGIPGEIAKSIPVSAQTRVIFSSGQANMFGYAYTETATYTPSGTKQAPYSARVGGTGLFAGILLQPKAASSQGGTTGPLSSNFALADNSYGTLAKAGAIYVQLPAAANIGDLLTYNTTTGAIGSIAPKASFTGAIAVTTGVLTVSAMGAGSPGIKIGDELTGTGVPVGTRITAFLTGTNGGVGTYQTNITTAVSSTNTMQTSSIPATGFALIPSGKVDYFSLSAAGIAIAKLSFGVQ